MRDLPARTALRCANSEIVNRHLMQRHESALALHRDHVPRLSGLDLQIVEGLRRDGIYVTSLAELGLPGSNEMLSAGQELAAGFAAEARRRAAQGQEFVIVSPDAIASRPEIFAWGLNERLLDIVEAYLGLPVAYDGVNLIYTVADGREAGPRCWHRDWEDRRTIKVGIYCNDVAAGGGPFQMIRRREPGHGGANGYRYMLADDAALAQRLGADYARDLVSCEGAAGTVFFCETAEHFHRGQPAHYADRGALFHSYFARSPRHPFFCERSGLSRSQVARLAGPLNPRQRACALWRRELSLPAKLVPPAGL
ncbi:hypothetical protein [Novosphingobium sp. BL-52-GroH]|uniref:hypothetical protein n=1 Tax=Novosphingobium sp. BL-52-GroH TaxID=3349877 RepID=UPI00384E2E0B